MNESGPGLLRSRDRNPVFVRYFGQLVSPRLYRRGFGFVGFLIWLVDLLRFFLERWLVFTILKLEMRRAGATRREVQEAVEQAKLDVSTGGNVATTVGQPKERGDRYKLGRAVELRPTPISSQSDLAKTIAAAAAPRSRELRYFRGRQLLIQEDNNE